MGPIIRLFCSSDVNYVNVCDLSVTEEDEEEETPAPKPEVEAEKEKPEEKQDEEGKILSTPHVYFYKYFKLDFYFLFSF